MGKEAASRTWAHPPPPLARGPAPLVALSGHLEGTAGLPRVSVARARPRLVLPSSLGPHCVCLHWAVAVCALPSRTLPQASIPRPGESTKVSVNPRRGLSAPSWCFPGGTQPAGQAGCLSPEPAAKELELQEPRTGERFSQVLTKPWDKIARGLNPSAVCGG